MKLHGKGYV
jgi:imidazolonepropionase